MNRPFVFKGSCVLFSLYIKTEDAQQLNISSSVMNSVVVCVLMVSLAIFTSAMPGGYEDVLIGVFDTFDRDGDGYIVLDELRFNYNSILKGERRSPEDLFAEADTDRDGRVSLDEFLEDARRFTGELKPHRRICTCT